MFPGRATIAELARRPGVDLVQLLAAAGVAVNSDDAIWAALELRYEGYMRRERASAARIAGMESFELPDLDYPTLGSLSFEAREKLASIRPATLGQASRVPGVSPSDLQGLVLESLKVRTAGALSPEGVTDTE